MGQVGTLVSLSTMKNRREGASSLSFGMSHVLTRVQLRTLELLGSGCHPSGDPDTSYQEAL